MKKFTLIALVLFFTHFLSAQVGVGTTTPNVNAQLDVVSATKGLLLPRLNQTQADALATTLLAATEPAGMLIENTTIPCIQRWSGTSFQCLAIVTGGAVGNGGAVKLNLAISDPPAANLATDPGYINLAAVGGQDRWYSLNVATPPATSFTLSPPPVTSWPENEASPVLTSIWKDNAFTVAANPVAGGSIGGTADAFVENGVLGQVHFWRINIRNNSGSSSQEIVNVRLRNAAPGSTFQTSAVTLFSPAAGSDLQTVILVTIADSASLPPPFGTGNGYVLEFRSGSGSQQIWVDSITRISAFAD